MANQPSAAESPHLQRRFGLLQSTALNMSNMVGVGPFITIPALMGAINGGGPQAMLGWIVGLLIAIPDGLVWAELGAAMPGSGGSYVYLREGFGRETWGRLMAFLFIWQFIISGPLEIGTGFIGFKQYLHYFWPVAGDAQLDLRLKLITAALGVVAIALLYRKINSIGKITVALWIGVLLTTGVVIFGGAGHFNPRIAFDFPPKAFDFSMGFVFGIGAAARIGIYDYLGYYDVCYLGDEVKNPGKVIPRSILISLFAVAVIYIAMNLSINGVISWREFALKDPNADAPPIASIFIEKLYGSKAALIFTVMVLWTSFASVFALMLGYSRIPFAAAQDGGFFRIFGKLHRTKQFPHFSLLLIGVLSIAASFYPLQVVIDTLVTMRILVQFIGQIFAVMRLRKIKPASERPFKMWLYPLPALLALAGWIFLFVTSGENQMLYSTGALIVGIVAFLIWSAISGTWPFQKRTEA
ncbi:MAG TPA: APC family permease [Verrucomicrobiae bacterium]|jgi:amino acid transporter|nr:APC family permease [Verrucomicrobiae bacterium]